MEIPTEAQKHLDDDHVVWLTTVTDAGAPAPFPVWFVPDGDDVLVFSQPTARRVHNIGQRSRVSLNFNSGPHGDDAWIIDATASTAPGRRASEALGYLAKYQASIEGELSTTVEDIDATYSTEIRIRPRRVRTI
jgi:PPOX class probable F420-dependent enzyme